MVDDGMSNDALILPEYPPVLKAIIAALQAENAKCRRQFGRMTADPDAAHADPEAQEAGL